MNIRNRKSTLAAGIAAGVLAAGGIPAAALADGPTLYGQIHLSLDQLDNGDDSALNLSSNRSRLGIKGDFDIQEGIKGIWQIESELRADSANSVNAGTLASRNTFIGLQGGFGTVRAGRFDTPVKLIGRQVELFANQVGDLRNLARDQASPNRFDERPHNSIGWDSKRYAGVQGSAQLSTNTNDGATADNDNDTVSLALNYAEGPLYVGLGFERNGNTAAGQDDPSALRLGAYYDLGNWRLTALWQSISAAQDANDEDVYGVGARYRHDAWTYKAQVYQLSADADDRDATLVAVGAEYAWAKPLTVYLDYAFADNDANRGITPYREGRGDNLLIAANGEKASALSLGAIYRF